MLGYRDSGMPDSEANANPLSFAQAPMDEAVGRLVGDHPAHAAAGDPHLRRRAGRLPAPRPHQGARHHPARRRPGRRPRLVPGGGRAVAGVEDLLLGLVAEAHRADARQVPRARTSSRPSARTGSSARRRTTASPRRSTSRASPRCASRRCSPTPPRSTPSRRSGSACPATWLGAIHPYDDYVRATSLVDAPDPGGRPLRRPPRRGQRLSVAKVPFLSEAWLDLQRALGADLPERPGPRPACSTSSPARPTVRSATSTPSSTAAPPSSRSATTTRRRHLHAHLRRRPGDRARASSTPTRAVHAGPHEDGRRHGQGAGADAGDRAATSTAALLAAASKQTAY